MGISLSAEAAYLHRMTGRVDRYTTPVFTVERIAPEVNLFRYCEGIVVNAALIEESLRVRRELPGEKAYASIALFPSSATFDTDLVLKDLYRDERPDDFVKALAVVTEGGNLRDIAELYHAEYPPFFKVRVFNDLESALLWVRGILDGRDLR